MSDVANATAPTEASAPAVEAKPAAPVSDKRTIKVDGKDVEVTWDDAAKAYTKVSAADQRFREAAEMRKWVETQIHKINSAESIEELQDLIPKDKFRKLAEKLFLEEIEYNELPESEKKLRALAKEKKLLEDKLKNQDEQRAEQERAYYRKEAEKSINDEIPAAFRKLGIAMTKKRVADVASLMSASFVQEGEPIPAYGPRISAEKALEILVRESQQDIADFFDGSNLEEQRKRLPKKFLEGLRKSDVEAVKSQDVILRKSNPTSDHSRSSKKKMNLEEWFQNKDKKFRR